MIRRTTIAGLLCLAAAAAAPNAHAADGWKAFGDTSSRLATDGERLVVTSPTAGRLLVRDDRTGKAWRLTLPAGCTFTGIIGGGSAAAECGMQGGDAQIAPITQPVPLFQPRYVLVHLTTGALRPVPPLVGTPGNHESSPFLVALGSRWAAFTAGDSRSGSRRLVRLADGVQQVDDGRAGAVWPDLGSPSDQALQPLCAPVERPVRADGFEPAPRPSAPVAHGGGWTAFADGQRVVAWRCGEPAPVTLATCSAACSPPQLGGGLVSFFDRDGARITRLRDRRTFPIALPVPVRLGERVALAHTRRYVYASAVNGPDAGRRTVMRRAVPRG